MSAVTSELEQEQSVVARVAGGDRAALTELYERYRRPLLGYLLHLTPDRGLAEEILQDTVLAVWQSAQSYEGRASVRGWLFGIARRQAHNTLRRRGPSVVDPSFLNSMTTADPAPEEVALARATAEELAAAIERLAPIHREVLILTFAHGLSYQELGEVLDVPIGTVKSRLSNAKRSLRAVLRETEEQPR